VEEQRDSSPLVLFRAEDLLGDLTARGGIGLVHG
jgi:hypothetical protein